ncbi:hypothetical protein D3C85_1842500 [compost metagenome]
MAMKPAPSKKVTSSQPLTAATLFLFMASMPKPKVMELNSSSMVSANTNGSSKMSLPLGPPAVPLTRTA